MLDEMLLLTATASSDAVLPTENNISGTSVLSIDSNYEHSKLVSLTVQGYTDSEMIEEIGYAAEDGSSRLDVRVHGESFMDGRELVRLMQASGSPAYGGEYDDEHFIYRASDTKSYTVVSTDHLALPRAACCLTMTATLEEDINNGAALVPGLHFYYTAGSPTAIKSTSSGVGEVVMKGVSMAGYFFTGLKHKAVGKYMELPIRYDSVCMSVGNTPMSLDFVGKTTVFTLDHPLMGTRYGVYDELDCVSGRLTRRLGVVNIDESTAVEEMEYRGVICYRISLPEVIGDGYVMMNDFYDGSFEEFAEFDYTIFVPPTRDSVYLRVMDATDADYVKELIVGQKLLYPLKKEVVTQLAERVEPELGIGKYYLEVCSLHKPNVSAVYTAKE